MEPKLKETYIDTGKLKIEWHNFAYQVPESTKAAEASACAHAQGKFWPFHDRVYAQQPSTQGVSNVSGAGLAAHAAAVGLETEAFASCLARGTFKQAVADDKAAALARGITGTPSFIIGERRIVGPQNLERWTALIEAALAGKTS